MTKTSVLRDTNNNTMNDFNITLFEACELDLNRSKKAINRWHIAPQEKDASKSYTRQ